MNNDRTFSQLAPHPSVAHLSLLHSKKQESGMRIPHAVSATVQGESPRCCIWQGAKPSATGSAGLARKMRHTQVTGQMKVTEEDLMKPTLFRPRLTPVLLAFLLAGTVLGASAATTLVSRDATGWRYHKGTTEASDPRTDWREADFDDSGWSTGRAPFGYGSGTHEAADCNTVLGDMLGEYSSVFLRKTFTVADVDAVSTLRISADYDDGFIVWINGERVFWVNAPDGKPFHNAVAPAGHEAGSYENFYAPDKTLDFPNPGSFLENGQNVIAVQGFNAGLSSSDFKIDIELVATLKVADTKFSHDRGFYSSPFRCTITTDTPGATIRYSLNGTDPSTGGDTVSGTSPLAVLIDPGSGSHRLINGGKAPAVVLRAYAFKPGYDEPTDVDTQTYIFPAEVITQGNVMSGEDWCHARPDETALTAAETAIRVDTTMNPAYVNGNEAAMKAALKAIPSLSVAINYGEMFNSSGIYHNPLKSGQNWKRAISLELIEPEGSSKDGFQINCGIGVAGGASREPKKPKHSFNFTFKTMYGPSKLDYEVFPQTHVRRFDSLRLRGLGEQGHSLNDPWGMQTQRDQGWLSPWHRQVHLYVNGIYWGLFTLFEKPSDGYWASYYGGDKEDYDLIGHQPWHRVEVEPPEAGEGPAYNPNYSPSKTAWSAMANVSSPAGTSGYAARLDWLNMPMFIDWNIIEIYGSNHDWAYSSGAVADFKYKNYRLGRKSRNRLPGDMKFEYVLWDFDGGMKAANVNEDWTDRAAWIDMAGNIDFKMLFADRIYYNLLSQDGPMTPARARARLGVLTNEVVEVIPCETARWGGGLGETGTHELETDWVPQWNEQRDIFFAQRPGFLKTKFAARGFYPLIDPPGFNRYGGSIGAGFKLTLTNPNSGGTLVYKTDGGDPRASGGAKASGTSNYGSPIALTRTTHVKARVRKNNTTWSAVQAATFNYTAHYPNIRITEIMYNPDGGSDFEFIEIKNISGSLTVGLSEMTFEKGIRYTFAPDVELGPGQHIVLASHPTLFEQRYGFAPFGRYLGSLDNGGERVELVDCDGTVVTSVRYNDKEPWPEEPDGDGYSLVFDGTGDQDDSSKWRRSNLIGGSPGYDDGEPYDVVISEALPHTDLPKVDAIELHNAGSADVNIGGWYLSDSDENYKKFQIPSTVLPAGGYVVFDESDFNTDTNDPACFALSSHGDDIYLTKWDGDNLQFLAHEDFGGAANGVAFGRHTRTDGTVNFVAQSVADTLGGANAYPLVGDVVIGEVMYHAPEGGDYDFVEIYNRTDGTRALDNGTEGWKLNGFGYQFPNGTTLGPNEYVLVVKTNESAFRAKYTSVPAGLRFFGPAAGSLQNNGESLRLERPDVPDPEGTSWILVDRVKYNDNSPWPESPDGDGPSLERIAPSLYGNDPANWAPSLANGGTPGAANSGVLVGKTAGWLYHDEGADLGSAWRAPGYDDSAWDDGNAPLGYPDTNPDIDTETDFGDNPSDKQPTTYFRTRFMLGANPAEVSSLTLRVRYDDGYVAYLNGTEVARGGMPSGAPSFNTYANVSNGSGGSYQEKNLDSHISSLVNGVNVLAVELHQISATSSDTFMDLELVHEVSVQPPAAAPTFSPADGTSFSSPPLNVAVSTATSGATVFYTTDGSAPGPASLHGTGSVIVPLTDSATIKAYANRGGYNASGVTQASYTLNLPNAATPTIAPNGGAFYGSVGVTISTATSGATVFYTTDGTAPSPSNKDGYGKNSVNFTLTSSRTIKARAYHEGDYDPSGTANATFTESTPTVGFVSAVANGSESETAPTLAVELSGTSTQIVKVDYAATGGSAGTPADYTLNAGTLTFNPGQTTKQIAFSVVNDGDPEDAETIQITLSSAVNANAGQMSLTYTINDNDQLFTAYNDLCWVSGEPTDNVTTFRTGEGGVLVDYTTGDASPVSVTIVNGADSPLQGVPPAAGTDAHDLLMAGGQLGLNGCISYTLDPEPVTLTFSGLDAAGRYEFVVFGNRGREGYEGRTTIVTLVGVEPGFQNTSSDGTVISTTTLNEDTTTVANGNNTANGHVARFTQIDPGADGEFTITMGTSVTKYYINAFMLKAVVPQGGPGTETKIAKAATWRYKKGTTEASGPVHAWRENGFNDSGWTQIAAPLSYANGLGDMSGNYPSVFLRKTFQVESPDMVTSLALSVDYDDGFIAWLNGEEIARVNVQGEPGQFIAHDATCSGYNGATPATHNHVYAGGELPVLGPENVLAVQLFNNSLYSSDAFFDAELALDIGQFSTADDADQNGMQDEWEVARLGGTGNSNTNDTDLDGVLDIAEFVAGTDPTNEASFFGLDVGTQAGNLLVSFTATPATGPGYDGLQRRYALQARDALDPFAVWTGVPGHTNILGQGQTVVYTNTNPAGPAIYRGRVWLTD